MKVKKELSKECRAQAVILRKNGFCYKEIAKKLGISYCGVYKAVQRHEELGSFASRKRTGRPRITTPQDDRVIARVVKKSPKASSLQVLLQLPTKLQNISSRTVRRRLFNSGLKSYSPSRKPRLSQKNIRDRLTFCRKYEKWTSSDWEKVLFSDESTFTQFYSFCRHVRRPPGKRFSEKYMVPSVKQAPKVMVWGAVSAAGRAGLWFMPKDTTIAGAVYLNVLKEKLPTFMSIHRTTFFQHDGAPSHKTKSVSDWLQQEGYQILGPWPGNSPDLNVIENVWMMLKRSVAKRNPTSAEDLVKKIREVWVSEISEQYCRKLVHSMPDRIAAVLRNKGGHIKY